MATSPTKYYTMVLLVMLMNAIVNLVFYVSYRADVCYVEALASPTVVSASKNVTKKKLNI
jgi:hypothetical protein